MSDANDEENIDVLLDDASDGSVQDREPHDALTDPDTLEGNDVISDSADAPLDQLADQQLLDAEVCELAKVPQKVATAGEPGDISFISALKMIDFGDLGGDDPLTLGYDIDGCCTCMGDADPCAHSSSACTPPMTVTEEVCDGPGGRDNSVGMLMKRFSMMPNFGSKHWTKGLEMGAWSILFKVTGYNGLANDASVQVKSYIPVPLRVTTGQPPKWDGTDVWEIQTRSLVKPAPGEPWDIDKTIYYDNNAYVVNNQLVASFDEFSFVVSEGYGVMLHGGTMVVNVGKFNNLWTLTDGFFTARWKAQDLLQQLGRLELAGLPICPDQGTYNLIKSMACNVVESFVGTLTPTSVCNAVSMGMRFEARPAKLDGVKTISEVQEPCGTSFPPSVYLCETNGN